MLHAKTPQMLFATSDMYQALSRFCFTTVPELATAVADGSLAEDLKVVLMDLDWEEERALEVIAPLLTAMTDDTEPLFHALRVDYTHLFCNPKFSVMTPYEARFLGAEEGVEGSAIPLGGLVQSVKGIYRQVGFHSSVAPNERADHMGVELEFMQVLRKNQGICLRECNQEAFEEIESTAQLFIKNHLQKWVVPFFEDVRKNANEVVYFAIAEIALVFLHDELQEAN